MRRATLRSVLASRAMPFIALPLIAVVIYQLIGVFGKTLTTDKRIGRLEQEISELEQSKRTLEQFNDFLNSDFFAEKEAREKLGMQKPGEHVVVIPEFASSRKNEEGAPSAGRGQTEPSDRPANPAAWRAYFFE